MSLATLRADRLDWLQREAFEYFVNETNPANGLVADKTRPDWPASIAATGLALTAYPVAAERGFITRARAVERTLVTLRFLHLSPQSMKPDATGHKGFYYHFLDMQSGRRAWKCELSTVDTALLLAGVLTSASYFDQETEEENEIRRLADVLYRRADWQWAQNGRATITHGWKPESGFLKYRWEGYNEGFLLYVLGLGSPTYPLPEESYPAWVSTYRWKRIYDCEFLYAGPLFIHQLPHLWVDFRGIQDAFMRNQSIDYFENSRRATYVQQQYAIRNPKGFAGYSKVCWGITASDGPGPAQRRVGGVKRRFFNYLARGVPYGPDDGTIAPWAVVASLPFAPEIVVPAIQYFLDIDLGVTGQSGFKATYNPTYPDKSESEHGWVSPYHYGVNQGPIVLMIENCRSGLLWRLMRRCPYLVAGLRRAGFRHGWLE